MASSSADDSTAAASGSALDAPTTKWFDTFCTGLLPIGNLTGLQGQLTAAGSDLTKIQALVVSATGDLGTSLSKTAASLKPLPVPTFSGGSAFATKVIPELAKDGSDLTDASKKVAATNATKDPSGFAAAAQTASSALTEVGGSLTTAFTGLTAPAAIESGVEAIPSCSKLSSLG